MVRNDDCDTSRASGGFENPTFSSGDSNELVSLGLVPIEKKVDDLLVRHELSFVTRSEWQDKMLVQVFVPQCDVEGVLVGVERCGVGLARGTGYSIIPAPGTLLSPLSSLLSQSLSLMFQ